MASLTAPSIFTASRRRSKSLRSQLVTGIPGSGSGSVSLSSRKSIPSAPRRISCSANPETVDKVCRIVKKQLTLHAEASVVGASKFSQLGADSLDTVEIVMSLEEAFGISMDEESAEKIVTVQDAADLIEEHLSKK